MVLKQYLALKLTPQCSEIINEIDGSMHAVRLLVIFCCNQDVFIPNPCKVAKLFCFAIQLLYIYTENRVYRVDYDHTRANFLPCTSPRTRRASCAWSICVTNLRKRKTPRPDKAIFFVKTNEFCYIRYAYQIKDLFKTLLFQINHLFL